MPPAGEGATASEAPGSFQARSRPPMYSRTDNAIVNPFNRRLTAMLVTTEGVASTHRIGDSHFRLFPATLRALFGRSVERRVGTEWVGTGISRWTETH